MFSEVLFSKYVNLRIGKETNTSNKNSSDMVPTEGSSVYFGEGKTPAFVDILDVEEVIVEIVVGIVASGSFGHGD